MNLPLADRYAAILPSGVEEPLLPPTADWDELELQAHWFTGNFGREFVTTDGTPVRVVQFGVWNHEAGPDFSEAVVILNNTGLDMTASHYNRMDLLSDLGRVDVDGIKLAEVKGMKKVLNRLSQKGGWGQQGFRYEVQAAAGLQKQGYAIEFVGELIPMGPNYMPKLGQVGPPSPTDIDIIAKTAGETLCVQVKSSWIALNGGGFKEFSPEAAKRKMLNWIDAVRNKYGDAAKWKILVPEGVSVATPMQEVLRRFRLDPAQVLIYGAKP